jgi:anti-sigma regulatory factor (Ser/Thr protein kinase)
MCYASRFVLTSVDDIKKVASDVLTGIGRHTPLTDEHRFNIALVINELLVNSFEHANPSPKAPVVFAAGMHGNRLSIGVKDGGQGFEYGDVLTRLEQPAAEERLFEECGRGLRLVHALCKEIVYSGSGNSVEVRMDL